jgi:hypothetical protein
MQNKTQSIRTGFLRLLALLLALSLASSAILVWTAFDSAREQAKRQMLDTTRAMIRVVDGEFARGESVLRTLALSPSIKAKDWAAVDHAARTIFPDPDASIVIVDREGQELVDTGLPRGAALPKTHDPFGVSPLLDRGKTHICDLKKSAPVAYTFCVDVPMMVNGKAEYLMSVVMEPRGLAAIVDRQRLPSTWYGTILDSQGRIVWRSHDPKRFVGSMTRPSFLAALRTADEGVVASRSLNGVPTYAAYTRSPVSNWSFSVAAPRQQLDAGIWLGLLGNLATVVVLMIVGVIAALRWTRRVARSVEGLAAQAGALGRRESFFSPPTWISELDDIGVALSGADQTLRRRDAELARMNASLTQRIDITTAEREAALAQLRQARASAGRPASPS